MKKIIITIVLFLSCFCASAQFSRFMFFSAGYSFLTDVAVSHSNLADVHDEEYNVDCQESFQSVQWNFMSGMVSARMMLLPLTMNSSISLSATPTLHAGVIIPVHNLGSRYGVNIAVPVFAELNIGAAARYISSADLGFVIGVGFEYACSPLLSYALTDTDYTDEDFRTSWILPTIKLGLRHWSKKNRVKEINLKLGFGEKGKEFRTFGKEISNEYRNLHFGISFLQILNY